MNLDTFLKMDSVEQIEYTRKIIKNNTLVLASLGDGFNAEILRYDKDLCELWFKLYEDTNEWGDSFNYFDIIQNRTGVYLLDYHFGYYVRKNQLLVTVEDSNNNIYWIRRTGGQSYYQDNEFQRAAIQYMETQGENK